MASTYTLGHAIRNVAEGHVARVCVPGQWRVWVEGDAVKYEVMQRSTQQTTAAQGSLPLPCGGVGAALFPLADAVTHRM